MLQIGVSTEWPYGLAWKVWEAVLHWQARIIEAKVSKDR
jgi:hypothetical protein